ncbi:hypothetical protein ACSQ67_017474 [Phaseolus vulgaris]
MSNPSNNTLQRPSIIVVEKPHSKEKDMVMFLDHDKLERDLSNLSNEAYHVESASVPFVWESQPGTPKTTPKVKNKNSPKSTFLQTLFPKRRKDGAPSQTGSQNIWSYSSSSPSSSSSSSLSFSSPRPRSYSVPSSPMIHTRKDVEDEDLCEVTSSNLCFGNARSRGCYSSMFKKVLLGDFL